MVGYYRSNGKGSVDGDDDNNRRTANHGTVGDATSRSERMLASKKFCLPAEPLTRFQTASRVIHTYRIRKGFQWNRPSAV